MMMTVIEKNGIERCDPKLSPSMIYLLNSTIYRIYFILSNVTRNTERSSQKEIEPFPPTTTVNSQTSSPLNSSRSDTPYNGVFGSVALRCRVENFEQTNKTEPFLPKMTWDDHQSIIQQSKSWLWSKERRGRGNN
jgi:hypothetical protein